MKALMNLIILCLLAASLAQAAWSDYEEVHELRLEAGGLSQLDIEAGAGKLHVTGVAAGDAIQVTARIVLPDASDDEAKKWLERSLDLSLVKDGDRGVLRSELQQEGWFSRQSGRIDLEVRVPARLTLRIDDGSGEVDVRDMAADVSIDDGSGSIRVRGIGGSLRIDDGSGSVDVAGIAGDVNIVDGSGSIDVETVDGSVTIDDGSGSIDVREVGRDLVILDDGSGSLRTSRILGTVDDRS